MKKSILIGVLAGFAILSLAILLWGTPLQPAQALTESLSTIRVPEGKDFATLTFNDPWDIDQISDISQYLNGFGRNLSMTNIQVQDGVFTATSTTSTTDLDAYIFPLFPGLDGFMQIGDWGNQYPIDSSQYQCLYIAMKVNSTATNDTYTVVWYPDKSLTPPSPTSTSGSTYSLPLYPEWGASRYWKLFAVNLANPPIGNIGKPWTAYSLWQGLQVILTASDNISIAIDWIRLTPCHIEPQFNTTITWTPSASVTALWVRPQGTTRDIRLVNGVNGLSGSYGLDTQGLAPGVYSVGMGDDTTCCSQWSPNPLEINASPILNFNRPSPTSGEDYASSAGDAWDMSQGSDADSVECTSGFLFTNGLLAFDTQYPDNVDSWCLGPGVGEVDSRIFMNLPGTLPSGKSYRYLSYRMFQNGTIPLPVDGMVVRWIWTDLANCTRVSHTAAVDVGWHDYNIDLYHPYNGTPVQAANCSVYPLQPWSAVDGIMKLRFDPNENWTGNLVPPLVFHQEIDWIWLSKVDGVAQGTPYPIEITLNKDASAIQVIDYYYTTNLSQPTQNYIGSAAGSAAGRAVPLSVAVEPAQSQNDSAVPNQLATTQYLPLLMRNYSKYTPLQPNQIRYLWDTSAVPPGEYYICASAYDGLNLASYCSKAPLQIHTP